MDKEIIKDNKIKLSYVLYFHYQFSAYIFLLIQADILQ